MQIQTKALSLSLIKNDISTFLPKKQKPLHIIFTNFTQTFLSFFSKYPYCKKHVHFFCINYKIMINQKKKNDKNCT